MLNGLYCFFLGIVYGCELDTVTRVLGRVISGLFNFARQYLYWFSREELDGTMFKSFKVELVKGWVKIPKKWVSLANIHHRSWWITLCCIFLGRYCFGLETRVIIKILTHPRYPKNFNWLTLGWSPTPLKKKIEMADSKKNLSFGSSNSQYFFSKLLWGGPWVTRIKWCKEHWCVSTCRLSYLSSKTG